MEKKSVTDTDTTNAAGAVCAESNADVFFYNGTITRNNVLAIMEELHKCRTRKKIFLIMVTYGGDPHSAFKICRYIQDHYEYFTLFVPGFCKSAGTMFAIAANELVFAPFGELGPLDVQMAKPDQFQFDSGLVIGESLDTLEHRVSEMFKRTFGEMMVEQQGLISVNSALHAASEVTKAIYAPIMGRIDPEEVGVRQRALRIALDYGERLAVKSQNATGACVRLLAEKYSSHSFVIDKQEAGVLFRNVRGATDAEMTLVYALGAHARIEQSGNQKPIFKVLSQPLSAKDDSGAEERTAHVDGPNRDSAPNERDPGGTDGSSVAASNVKKGERRRGVSRRNAVHDRASATKTH